MTGSDLYSESTSLTAVGAWAKQGTGRSLRRVQEGDGGGGTEVAAAVDSWPWFCSLISWFIQFGGGG